MAEQQVAMMKLKVDLQCHKCYMKVKKVLCKFPHQIYDEKHNTVTIRVVCCSPEKLRVKLCCYGGGSIKSIEIVEISTPRPPGPPRPPRPTPRASADPEKPPSPPPAPPSEPQKQDDAAKPPPAVKFPEPVPVSVLAYPSPAASVGRGLGWPAGLYGTPIYDSYGGNGSSCLGYQFQHLHVEEDASMCTIA